MIPAIHRQLYGASETSINQDSTFSHCHENNISDASAIARCLEVAGKLLKSFEKAPSYQKDLLITAIQEDLRLQIKVNESSIEHLKSLYLEPINQTSAPRPTPYRYQAMPSSTPSHSSAPYYPYPQAMPSTPSVQPRTSIPQRPPSWTNQQQPPLCHPSFAIPKEPIQQSIITVDENSKSSEPTREKESEKLSAQFRGKMKLSICEDDDEDDKQLLFHSLNSKNDPSPNPDSASQEQTTTQQDKDSKVSHIRKRKRNEKSRRAERVRKKPEGKTLQQSSNLKNSSKLEEETE